MSNNNDDANEYLRSLVAQYLQQQQSSVAGGNAGAHGSAALPPRNFQPPTPSVQAPEPLHQLNALVASYLQAASSPSGAAAATSEAQLPQSAFANPLVQRLLQQAQIGQGSSAGPNNNDIGRQMLSSVAAINPALASAAALQALALQPAEQPGQLRQQNLGILQPQTQGIQPQQAQGYQLLANLSGRPTSLSVGANNPTMLSASASAAAAAAAQPNIINYASGGMEQGNTAVSLNTQGDHVTMKEWTAGQLEAHVKHLEDTAQPVPQSIAILLASARRKDEQYHAKKLANRKSAYASRERKKVRINAMARDNVKLKRESLILKSLPDPVIAIDPDGEITFINEQVQRMLMCEAEDLLGSNIDTITAIESREDLWKMIRKVLGEQSPAVARKRGQIGKEDKKRASSGASSGSDPNVVSLRSSERGKPPYKKRASETKYKSSIGASVDESIAPLATQTRSSECTELKSPPEGFVKIQPSLRSEHVSTAGSLPSLDSSLGKLKRKSPTSSDSGYRESNYSPEESNERSSSTMSNEDVPSFQKKFLNRVLPLLSPACIVSLVRRDLSLVWCELTASLRAKPEPNKRAIRRRSKKGAEEAAEAEYLNAKEVLICMRPISEGNDDSASLRSSKTARTHP